MKVKNFLDAFMENIDAPAIVGGLDSPYMLTRASFYNHNKTLVLQKTKVAMTSTAQIKLTSVLSRTETMPELLDYTVVVRDERSMTDTPVLYVEQIRRSILAPVCTGLTQGNVYLIRTADEEYLVEQIVKQSWKIVEFMDNSLNDHPTLYTFASNMKNLGITNQQILRYIEDVPSWVQDYFHEK